jgi:hypothetical protein
VIDELMGHEATGRAGPRQRHGRPLPAHHAGDGRPGHHGDRSAACRCAERR